MKPGLFGKLLLFVLVILLVNSLLTLSAFTYTSRNVFANAKAEELVPKAEYIAAMVSQYQRGALSGFLFESMVNADRSLWDARIHILDATGTVIATNVLEDTQLFPHLEDYVSGLLGGSQRMLITTSEPLGIVIGVPIYGVDAIITGVVFLTKPLTEVNAALSGLNIAMLISTLLAFVLLLLPTFIGSRRFTSPLTQMSLAARTMAQGDFSVRADEARKDEIGQLGASLNALSAALSRTIGDLMLERNRLRNVLDGLNEGIVAIDFQGFLTHCNPAALRLLRLLPNEESQAAARLEALWPEYAAHVEEMQTSTVVRAQGLDIKVTVTALYDGKGNRSGVIAMLQDVTEEIRLEQTRRDYVANVSHELRTPIASIRSLAEALSDGMVKKDDDKMRYYGYILRESMRLSRLINDLLELSRLQSGGVALIKSTLHLLPTLQFVAERFSSIATESGLQFHVELPQNLPPVFSNADRIEQVLVALLDNAIKYAPDEGAITFRATLQDDHILFSVCNTGEIDEAHLPHLFDRFYKADAAHAEQGTGLGLSITWEIVSLLGERIWVENCNGEACFHFTVHLHGNKNADEA